MVARVRCGNGLRLLMVAGLCWATSTSAQRDLLTIDEQINASLECAQICQEKHLSQAQCGCVELTTVASRRLRELEKGDALALDCMKSRDLEAAHRAAEKAALERLGQTWTRASLLQGSDAKGIPRANFERFRREASAIAARHPLTGERRQMRKHLVARERELRGAAKRLKVFATQSVYAEVLSALATTRKESFWLIELGVACGKLPLTAIIPAGTGVQTRMPASASEPAEDLALDDEAAGEAAGEHSSSHLDEYGAD